MTSSNLESTASSVVGESVVNFILADEEGDDVGAIECGGKMEGCLASGVLGVEIARTLLQNEFDRRDCGMWDS